MKLQEGNVLVKEKKKKKHRITSCLERYSQPQRTCGSSDRPCLMIYGGTSLGGDEISLPKRFGVTLSYGSTVKAFMCAFAPPMGEVVPSAYLSTSRKRHCDVIHCAIDTKLGTPLKGDVLYVCT